MNICTHKITVENILKNLAEQKILPSADLLSKIPEDDCFECKGLKHDCKYYLSGHYASMDEYYHKKKQP